MRNDTTNIADYSANILLEGLEITEPNGIEAASIRYAFDQIAKQGFSPDPLENRQIAANATYDKIGLRYYDFKLYRDYFFPEGEEHDAVALAAAIICDEMIQNVNAPVADWAAPDGAPVPHKFDGIDEDIVFRANVLWETALEIEANGLPEDYTPPLAAVFLAHINALENIRMLKRDFFAEDSPAFDIEGAGDEFRNFLKDDLPAIYNFAYTHTAIGQDLITAAEDLRDEILTCDPHVMRKAPARLALRIWYPSYE